MSERYIPEFFASQQEVLRLNAELRAERDSHHAFRIEVAKERFLGANKHDCDIPHLESYINGSNPRVDAEGRVIIDFGDDEQKGLTGTLDEAGQYWRSKPESFGNIVGITKPKEPSKQDLHNQKLMKMTPEQYNAYRKRRGRDYMAPESD